MFESSGNTGYVLKPQVLWNKQHPEYRKFNPFEKKNDGDYLSVHLRIISGQYLNEINHPSNYNSASGNNHHRNAFDTSQSSNIFVECEVIGIGVDCVKKMTKTANKNSLNPIWNEDFTFQVIKI